MTQGQSQVNLLTIQEFAQICFTTPRTLRFYEKHGLLKPKYRDTYNNYRYYDPEQARDFLNIRLMQNFHLPLKKIAQTIQAQNSSAILNSELKNLQTAIAEKQKEYRFLKHMKKLLLETEDVSSVLKHQTLGPYNIIKRYISNAKYDKVPVYRKELRDLAENAGFLCTDQEMTIYYSPYYEPKGTALEIAIIIKSKPAASSSQAQDDILTFEDRNISLATFPKTQALTYTYKGPYEYFILIYQKLFKHFEPYEKNIHGKVFDIYKRNPANTTSPYDYVSILAFPVT